MKLITWNCQGAFRKKASFILAHKPDILVIQECEHPDKLNFNSDFLQPIDTLWFGDNNHKGLAVFSYGDYKLKLLEQHNPEFKFIAPISVQAGKKDFTLLPVWANNSKDPQNRYIEQVWKAINYFDEDLLNDRTIITGDFNSNAIWDNQHNNGSHTDVVNKLSAKNIHSIYHKYFSEYHGKESVPTFYLQRNKNKPYHIDYCFLSQDLYALVNKFEIGSYDKWRAHSDHSPLFVEFNI